MRLSYAGIESRSPPHPPLWKEINVRQGSDFLTSLSSRNIFLETKYGMVHTSPQSVRNLANTPLDRSLGPGLE